MNWLDYLNSILVYLCIVPGAILCFAPFRNQYRFSRKKIHLIVSLTLALSLPAIAFVDSYFSLHYDMGMLPLLFLLYGVFHFCLNTHVSKSLGVFLLVQAYLSFVANISNGIDAAMHPESDIEHFSLEAAVIQFLLSCLLTVVFFHSARKYGAFLVDRMHQTNIWFTTVAVSGIFVVYNISIVPHYYITLHTHHVGRSFWSSLILMNLLLFLLCVLFYFLTISILKQADTEEQNQILIMQEHQYIAMKRYIKNTSKDRHDFKHTILTLKGLADNRDMDGIREYLATYIDSLPEYDITVFCDNHAINALLNHYYHMAKGQQINVKFRINLPKDLLINPVDFCSILGNILDNAVLACQEIPEEERKLSLSITLNQGNEIYIVAANSFDGHLNIKNGRYLSTHKNGKDIGLISISQTAALYRGSADFHHENRMFYSDILLKNIQRNTDSSENPLS